jgi:hypothetical protein
MAIPRDLGSPFNPDDPIERAEWEGFGPDVPNTRGMINAVKNGEVNTAQIVRAQKLFRPDFLAALNALAGDNAFPTPDPLVPTVNFGRAGRTRPVDIFAPGDVNAGNRIRIWSFDDTTGVAPDMWPAPTIRVREGQIIHTLMSNSHGPHTIHHHGIEPTPVNDGVGHLTMEIGGVGDGGNYHYQWKAAEAGTYFYHCHRNTVLHFELGMYGMLIVDPDVPGAPFADGGPGVTLVGDTPTAYHRETFWVVDDIDLSWHESTFFDGHDKSFGIQDPNPYPQPFTGGFQLIPSGGLNDFYPDFFVVTGVTVGLNGLPEQPTLAQINRNPILPTLHNFVQPSIAQGQKLLIRALNASYCTSVWRFPTGVDGTVTAVDARTLGRHGFGEYSQPFRLSSLPLVDGYRQFSLSTAQRWDILIDEGNIGVHQVLVDFHHWNNYDEILHTARLPITITA